jgi:hypothetical protein
MLKILTAPIPAEIEITGELMSALQKARVTESLSNAERFEVSALIFIAARALRMNNAPALANCDPGHICCLST